MSRLVVPKPPRLVRWIGLAALGFMAVAGGALGSYQHRQAGLEQARAEGNLRADIEAIRRWSATVSVRGGDLAEWNSLQANLTRDAGLAKADQALEVLRTIQGWPVAEVVQGQAAQASLPQAWADFETADAALARQSTLTGGSWGARLEALRTQLKQFSLPTLTSVFAAQEDHLQAQSAWANSIQTYAQNMDTLAKQANEDVNLPSSARQAMTEWSQRWQAISTAANTLTKTGPARVQAEVWATQLNPVARRAEASLGQARIQVGWPEGVFLAGVLLALIGVAGLFRGLQTMSAYQQSQALLGQRRKEALKSLERLGRQLQEVGRGDRGMLQEDRQSPGHTLAERINALLDVRRRLQEEVDRHQLQVSKPVEVLRRALRDARVQAQTEQGRLEQSGRQRLAQAQALATLGQQARRAHNQTQEMVSKFQQANVAVQETAWRNEALREGTQGQAKSLKRLSEGTQGIGVLVDNIQTMARRLHVQAMNAGIEAAHLGSAGRKLSLRTQEMETLASATIQASQDVIQNLRHVQDDTQSVLTAMEENTTNVVETGNRSALAMQVIQELERHLGSLFEASARVIDGLEARAVDEAQLAQLADTIQQAFEQSRNQLDAVDQASVQAWEEIQNAFADLAESLRALPGA